MGDGARIASVTVNACVAVRRPIVYPADTDFDWSFPHG
jgi:hypothetical protein